MSFLCTRRQQIIVISKIVFIFLRPSFGPLGGVLAGGECMGQRAPAAGDCVAAVTFSRKEGWVMSAIVMGKVSSRIWTLYWARWSA